MFFSPIMIWLMGVLFALFQLFLQLSSGIIIGVIMKKMHFSALAAGLLSSVLYIIYTGMQIPVGALFDRKNTKILIALNVFLCGLGCFLFSQSTHIYGLFMGRILMGFGSSFAFVGLSHILRQYFPLNRFAFMIGLSETLGFFISVLGIMGLGFFIDHWGWRHFMMHMSIIGITLSLLCWIFIPAPPQRSTPHTSSHLSHLHIIIMSKIAWINGLFVGLCFAIVTVFGALWAAPFLQSKLACSLETASFLTAIFFLGTGLSCPLFGLLSSIFKHRRLLMAGSAVLTTIWLCLIIYSPCQSSKITGSWMLLCGLSCGAYMLSYSIANEIAPEGAASMCTGFTNTLAVITAPILQPLIGLALNICHPNKLYTLQDYQWALSILPLSTIIACALAYYLPEKP